VDNLVNKSWHSAKDGANGMRIHQVAYFLGIRLISVTPQVIVAPVYVPYFLAYS
jgi:hypothetical protein